MGTRPGVMIYFDIEPCLAELSQSEKGDLLDAVLLYGRTGSIDTMDSALVRMAFQMAKSRIDRDADRYEETCAKRLKASRKRWDAENTKANMQMVANESKSMQVDANANKMLQMDANYNSNTNYNSNHNSIDIDISSSKKKRKSPSKFVPPTLEEVSQYCKSRKSPVDPKKFYEYFNEGNWIDSRGERVRNWKQKLQTWEGYDVKTDRTTKQTQGAIGRGGNTDELPDFDSD